MPDTLQDLLTQAHTAIDENRLDAAIELSSRAIALDASSALAYYSRGIAYGRNGVNDKAIADISEAIRLDPAMWKAYRNRGTAYLMLQDYDRAITDFNEAIRIHPNDPDLLASRGECYYRRDDCSCALALQDCNEAIRIAPTVGKFYALRAFIYCAVHKPPAEILGDLDTALRLDPGNALAWGFRGDIHQSNGNRAQALHDYDESLRLDGRDPRILHAKASILYKQGDYAQALDAVNEAIRLRSDDTDFYVLRAIILDGMKKDPADILRDAEEALRLNPKNALAWTFRGYFYKERGDFVQALHNFGEAIRIQPDWGDAHRYRVRIYYDQGEYDKAKADLSQAIQRQADIAEIHEIRGTFRIEHGDYEGIADLHTASRLQSAGDTGFEASPKLPVDEAAVRHGEWQVRLMLHDRPAMAQYGEKADVLCRWAAAKFAGEDLRKRFFWNPADPAACFDGENQATHGDAEAYVSIRGRYKDGPDRGKERSFEELWATAVFECYNIANVDEFERLRAEAADGKLSADEYADQTLQSEQLAVNKTRAFYMHVFFPWAKAHSVPTNPALWYFAQDTSKPSVEARQYYKNQYDFLVLRAIFQKDQYGKVADLVEQSLARTKLELVPKEILVVYGYCLLKLHKPSAAVDAFNKALAKDPQLPDALFGRTVANVMLRENGRVRTDCSELIRLRRAHPKGHLLASDFEQKVNGVSGDAETPESMVIRDLYNIFQSTEATREILETLLAIERWCNSPASAVERTETPRYGSENRK